MEQQPRDIEKILAALAARDPRVTREEILEVLELQVGFLRHPEWNEEMTFEEGLEELQHQLDFERTLDVSEEARRESDGLREALRRWHEEDPMHHRAHE